MNYQDFCKGTKYTVVTHRSGTQGTMEQKEGKLGCEQGKKVALQRN